MLILYGPGQGVVAPPLATGQLAPAVPLSWAPDAHAFLGGNEAPVWFAGMAPEFAGLLQMNVLVPQDAQTGDAVPLRIEIAGHNSPEGTTVAVN